MRSLADRLEAVRHTLPAVAAAGHPSETAWPMTHLVSIAAEASDEYLFRAADPEADRTVLAAFTTAVFRTGQGLSLLADATGLLLAPEPRHTEAAQRAVTLADNLTLAIEELNSAADRLTTAAPTPVVPLPTDDLERRRGAQSSASAARSRIVSTQPATGEQAKPSATTAPVIPLHRGR
ncbi:hypothetical protein KV557_00255 [Kitasatospora aureofaciens]|uniref:hypothetical protein n=1 Tax=Kitasatospora aureofaciens TaxID=1894 RepID=UPI001C450192|nr:hypothetical protein [Kitasatospora aureofaciens]MBV6695558.1 hypothetical protein [Kitasatospora aureofaciens]